MPEKIFLYDAVPSEDPLEANDVLDHFTGTNLPKPLILSTRGAIFNALLNPKDQELVVVTQKSLGVGGYSEVFQARSEAYPAQDLALKRTRLDKLDDDHREVAIEMALRECGALALLTGVQGVAQWLALYMDPKGEEIMTLLRKESGKPLGDDEEYDKGLFLELEPAQLYQIGQQMIEILIHIHDRGIAHGDLKPSQFLVDQKQNNKTTLIDFQMSLWDDYKPDFIDDDVQMGTLQYMSPEQVRDEWGYGRHLMDLWSMGVIFFQFFSTNRMMPFWMLHSRALQRALAAYPDSPYSFPDFDDIENPGIRQMVEKLLAPKQIDRYQSARELLTEYYLISP